jgi:plasmid stability protein
LEAIDVSTLTIRNFDDDLKAELRLRAARHGRSMEGEARAILRSNLSQPEIEEGLGTRISALFADLGDVELVLPSRAEPPRQVEFPE